MVDFKHPLGFANWSMVIGFLISWGIWYLLSITLFPWGFLTIHDGFAITVIFTISSWLRTYGLNKLQQFLIRKHLLKGKVK